MKPILFNTDMVRAILDGHKTVTRRVVKERELIDRPPYRPGDILYVRETWTAWSRTYGTIPRILYKADWYTGENKIKWRPSIHMPREAARIFLRVTDVRVQQIKDITDADALREGFYSRASLIAEILKIYPELTENSWVWVIEFERRDKPEE